MKLIWTKSTLPLSILIRWGFGEPCSHFAIIFDDALVFHSNLKGVHLQSKTNFLKHAEIVHDINIPLSEVIEENLYKAIISKLDGKPYDMKAFFFFIYRGFLLKFFNKPLPLKNEFDDNDSYLCTELAYELTDYIDISNLNLAIVTPQRLYNHIKK